ncbi:uncharacterized protein FOBCDRAFT_254180 [Fusarium oxysporum Fo47]|nr:uncharacterized protein FOBCDRAFT_254180 [Fusarium oxysporum Fo47]QKD61961.2 hypothetical protein FOBCDRAFT_254180 [Fusarium oxysporum Fo47]
MANQLHPFQSASSQMPALTLSPGQLFIQSQLCTKPEYPPKDLDLAGRTAIITGANNGIGFACTKLLLQHKLSHLIIAVRSEEKGSAAAEQLRRTLPSSSPQIDVWKLDMASYSSIEDFSKRCETLPRIDFVFLNAGMGGTTFNLNKATGHEETMQVNFLSTMYLSVLLLPVLTSKAPAPKPSRLTIVSSGTAMHCELPEAKADHIISALDLEANFDGMGHYAKSKLLGQLFIDRLSQHVDPSNVVINLVDPGLTKGTGLMDKSSGLMKIVMAMGTRVVGRTQEQAASAYVDAAIVKREESHGSYIMDWKICPIISRSPPPRTLSDRPSPHLIFIMNKVISGSNALVVGGTSGIGYAIAKRLATSSNYQFSSITILGRTKPQVMPAEKVSFRSVDATSMHALKEFAQEFRSNSQNTPLDLLVMTQGIMSFAGRTETPEGIDRKMALHYYGRQLLIRELSPILSHNAKVLLVLDGLNGSPEKLNWDDLDLKETFSLAHAANHCICMNDTMIQYHALQNQGSKQFFAHGYPGVVNTATPKNSAWYFRAVSKIASRLVGLQPEQCAERQLDGLYKAADELQSRDMSWACIDNHGKVIGGKKEWSEEERRKIADHTWALVDRT